MNQNPPQWKTISALQHTVLIIEDDHQFRSFLADLLLAAGFQVAQADGGEIAQ